MAPSKAAAAVAPFDKGERVLCFHHDMLYEAKILECRSTEDNLSYQYKIHYKGWKNTWDDWVPQDRVRKFTDENKELAAQLHTQMKAIQQAKTAPKSTGKRGRTNGSDFSSARGSEERHVAAQGGRGAARRNRDFELEMTSKAKSNAPKAKSNAPGTRSNITQANSGFVPQGVHPDELFASNDGREDDQDPLTGMQESEYFNRPSVSIPVPDYLKAILVDDWENVTKLQLVVPLPHPVPVSEIFRIYRESEIPKRVPGSAQAEALDDFCAGMLDYFDNGLGRILLYRFERVQYSDVYYAWKGTNKDLPELAGKSASETYGAEHLARLIISFPELIAQTNMDQQSINRLREEVAKLITLLTRTPEKFFVSEYENPGQAYIDEARRC